jgi:hypothetical protein
MKKTILLATLLTTVSASVIGQSPAVTSWLHNTTETGSYYTSGNSTTISNSILVNCQQVEYSTDFVYVHTKGVPAYPTGPFLDNNPSNAEDQDAIFKFPLNPLENTGTAQETVMGNIGVFINGVALFDYRDGVAWDNSTSSLCGGPGNSPCPGGPTAVMDWNRDAIPAEMEGFDCSKGHPAMGNYHHHQNPSAFKLDQQSISTICNLYDADGLYAIDSTEHSPLIGFAYDGFPIYGAYGFMNVDGTGGIVRMKTSYSLNASATTRTNGPTIDATYFNGYFKEDYHYNVGSNSDYLDEHNGRFCNTPEYPNGTYAYFCTVDEAWNSSYPYAVGPTFYGTYSDRSVSSVSETTTTYTTATGSHLVDMEETNISIFPNPASDLIAIQVKGLVKTKLTVELYDVTGKKVRVQTILRGQTIGCFDTQSLYEGTYILKITNGDSVKIEKVVISR